MIVSLMIKFISDFVTNRSVVAAQTTVKKIVKFLNDLTLNGWTNFHGTNVKIDKIIIITRFIHSLVFRIKKYKTTTFHKAGNPWK